MYLTLNTEAPMIDTDPCKNILGQYFTDLDKSPDSSEGTQAYEILTNLTNWASMFLNCKIVIDDLRTMTNNMIVQIMNMIERREKITYAEGRRARGYRDRFRHEKHLRRRRRRGSLLFRTCPASDPYDPQYIGELRDRMNSAV